jgi:hypothetical protein
MKRGAGYRKVNYAACCKYKYAANSMPWIVKRPKQMHILLKQYADLAQENA